MTRHPAVRRSVIWLALLACSAGPGATVDARTANRIIAVVNDDIITEADVTSRIEELQDSPRAETVKLSDPAEMRQAMLRHLIEQRLILQEAKRLDITVEGAAIIERMEQIRSRFPSDDAMTEALARSGLTREGLREQIREQLTAEKVIASQVRSKLSVSPQEVADALRRQPEAPVHGEQVRASHILIRVTDQRPEPQARALAEDVRRRLVNGEDFAALAKQFSEDPHADAGGDMGWVSEGQLLPDLNQAVFALKPGELSAPVETRLGYHLVRVDERRTGTSQLLLDANTMTYHKIYEAKFKDALRIWLNELTKKAYIEILSPQGGESGVMKGDTGG
jgi:parvulin-like peptidyl-prolyl isomerase